VAHITDLRASLALGTVKKRIRMCGRPAVPNISAMPKLMAEIGSLTKLPGPMIDWPILAASSAILPPFSAEVGLDLHRLGEHRLGAEAEVPQHHEGHEGRAAQQQAGLDDLHPGGGGHAAEQHIDHHQRADDHHRDPVLQAEQQLDQLARTDHLRDQVESHHHQRAAGREDAHRGLLEAERGHVGKGELAQVAQALGHQEGDHRPADQEADRVDQAVEAAGHHRRRDAQEGRRRHVVAGDRQAVLETGDAAAGGVEVGRALGLGGGPLGDEQREHHEDAEHADGGPVGGLLLRPGRGRRRRPDAGGYAARAGQRQQRRRLSGIEAFHFSTALEMASVSSSNSLLARRT
jgi:hypothetical protein